MSIVRNEWCLARELLHRLFRVLKRRKVIVLGSERNYLGSAHAHTVDRNGASGIANAPGRTSSRGTFEQMDNVIIGWPKFVYRELQTLNPFILYLVM